MAQLSDPGLPAVLQALLAAISAFNAAAVLPPGRVAAVLSPANGVMQPQTQRLLAGGVSPVLLLSVIARALRVSRQLHCHAANHAMHEAAHAQQAVAGETCKQHLSSQSELCDLE